MCSGSSFVKKTDEQHLPVAAWFAGGRMFAVWQWQTAFGGQKFAIATERRFEFAPPFIGGQKERASNALANYYYCGACAINAFYAKE